MRAINTDAIRLPDLQMTDVSDCYTMYVEIMGVSEDVFWFQNIAFVKKVAANKRSYRDWIRWQSEKKQKENGRR